MDGKVLTEPVGDTFAAGKQAHIPLLAGWNSDEGSFMAMRGMTSAQWKALADKTFPGPRRRVPQTLPRRHRRPSSAAPPLISAAINSSPMVPGTGSNFSAKPALAPVYRYHFELAATPSKYHPGTFAFHSDDIEYVFGTLDTRPGWNVRPEDRTLSEQVMTYWTNFAKTGDPNGAGVPNWPKYNDAGYPLIHLDTTVTATPDATRPRYEFLEKGMPSLRF